MALTKAVIDTLMVGGYINSDKRHVGCISVVGATGEEFYKPRANNHRAPAEVANIFARGRRGGDDQVRIVCGSLI